MPKIPQPHSGGTGSIPLAASYPVKPLCQCMRSPAVTMLLLQHYSEGLNGAGTEPGIATQPHRARDSNTASEQTRFHEFSQSFCSHYHQGVSSLLISLGCKATCKDAALPLPRTLPLGTTCCQAPGASLPQLSLLPTHQILWSHTSPFLLPGGVTPWQLQYWLFFLKKNKIKYTTGSLT